MSQFVDTLIGENVEVATEYFRALMAESNLDKNSGGSIGFIPFNIFFTMDGLSGIKIYNELTFDTSFLPPGYANTLDFIVTGVDHKLKDGDWETEVKVTLIPKTDDINTTITGSAPITQQIENYEVPPPNEVGGGEGGNNSTDPSGDCGKASPNTVDTVYPKSVKWNGPQPVIYPATTTPTVTIKLSEQPTVPFVRTLATYEEFIKAADSLVNTMIPGASTAIKKRVVASALAVGISEQGSGDKIKGFNNNLTGVEASGFKVFAASDVNGKVQATEGGTGLKKFYYSFSSLKVGLIPLVSKIIERNMFAQADDPNQWAWRYFRDWNGYGARTLPQYKSGELTDCQIISGNESKYNKALSAVNQYSSFR